MMISYFLLEIFFFLNFIIKYYKGWRDGSVSIFYFSLDLTHFSVLTGQSITKYSSRQTQTSFNSLISKTLKTK